MRAAILTGSPSSLKLPVGRRHSTWLPYHAAGAAGLFVWPIAGQPLGVAVLLDSTAGHRAAERGSTYLLSLSRFALPHFNTFMLGWRVGTNLVASTAPAEVKDLGTTKLPSSGDRGRADSGTERVRAAGRQAAHHIYSPVLQNQGES